MLETTKLEVNFNIFYFLGFCNYCIRFLFSPVNKQCIAVGALLYVFCLILIFERDYRKNNNKKKPQLLSITHDIYKSFDYNPSVDIRGVFLDISKAKFWHDGLIFKSKTMV